MIPVSVQAGKSPIVLGMPHTGTYVPDDVWKQLNKNGRKLTDTDWHIDRLYAGLIPEATTVKANFHRYVIDANRDPAGGSLYPGQNTTGLVPQTDFNGQSIWQMLPSDSEIKQRCATFHARYHYTLKSELERVHALHGIAILYDCHSIRSNIPFLFDGTLPDFNIGTNLGSTCDDKFETETRTICEKATAYSTTTNGRFKGGWTTRHYGQPTQGIHAIQMELAQSTYLTNEAAPWIFDDSKSAQLRPHLASILTKLVAITPSVGGPQ